MPKTTAIETTNANKIFDIPVKLAPGQVNTMSFPQDSISEMRLMADNKLEVAFRDGSKVQIENFDELVNSAQSCGRDTIIQLSDNTIIYPEELNAQLSAGPVAFGDKDAGQTQISLNAPKAGQTVEKNIEPGKEYKLGFDTDATSSAAQAGNNLIITFKDGGIMVMKNYFTSMNSELPPAMTLADGAVVDSQALLTSCKIVETPSYASTVESVEVADAQVAAVEPAAGEEAPKPAKAEKVAMVEPAAGEDVANIEPAAGDGGGLSGGRGGYGFASEPVGVALNGINPTGILGATNLGYTAPNYRNGPTGLAPTAIPVTPGPFVASAQSVIDESGAHDVSGKVNFNFGNDGPSVTVPPIAPTDAFAVGGSVANNVLTSNGHAVSVSRAGDTFTGTANGQTVFTFVMRPDGTYTFTQMQPLDHADTSNPNDRMTLNFGIVATDRDGDTATTSVNIIVFDDAPVAVDDVVTVGAAPQVGTGNVLTNDNAGFDGDKTVVGVSFNGKEVAVPLNGNVTVVGQYGTLVLNSNGTFTYTSNNSGLGTDTFVYTMRDFDGDQSSAKLEASVNDLDTTPVIVNAVNTVDETNMGPTTDVSGKVSANFFGDGPGTITGSNSFSSGGSKAGGNLTSNGAPVSVTYANGVYTGTAGGNAVFTLTVNNDGSYNFVLSRPLDHADKLNPNDNISLNFGINATDNDGDVGTGTITINVLDDGPVAVADTGTVTAANPTITGNVTSNDDFGSDGKPTHSVTKIIFNGVTTVLPTDGSNVTVTSPNGVLTINNSGQYSYTSTTTSGGRDVYSYVIQDRDGDTDTTATTSTLTINVDDVDYTPTVTSDVKTVDETNMNPTTGVIGNVTANYFGDGPGAITGSNSFSSDGSKTGGNLTSNGAAVSVSYTNGVYTGTANGQTVFTLTVNPNGSYSFVLNRPLDHADKSNPNDSIGLNFGIIATDKDGDTAPGSIRINVLDDGPTIAPSSAQIDESNFTTVGTVTGKVNVDYGSDAPGAMTSNNTFNASGSLLGGKLTSNGVTVVVTQTANGYVGKAGNVEVFTFTIGNDGNYTYTQKAKLDHADPNNPNDVINLNFGVRATDSDGDTANTNVTINVLDDGPEVVNPPEVLLCVNNYEDNVMLPTNHGVYVFVTADSIGSGNQVMKITMTGINPSWIFGADYGSFNAATGTWTFTTKPGESFDGKFYFQPPTGSTVDMTGIKVTVVATDGNQTVTETDDFNIIVGGFDGAGVAAKAMAASDDGLDSMPVNDNLENFSNVIEMANNGTQSAIDNFVYSTSTNSSVSTNTNTNTNAGTSSAAAALATSASEELHQVQQQIA